MKGGGRIVLFANCSGLAICFHAAVGGSNNYIVRYVVISLLLLGVSGGIVIIVAYHMEVDRGINDK